MRDIARRWPGHAERVEAVAVQLRFDDWAGAGVEVLGHAVQVQLVEDFVGPWVRGEVEDDGIPPPAVGGDVAFVARLGEEVRAGCAVVSFMLAWSMTVVLGYGGFLQSREIFIKLQTTPRHQDVFVGLVDGVSRFRVVANHCCPGIVQIGNVPRLPQLVA